MNSNSSSNRFGGNPSFEEVISISIERSASTSFDSSTRASADISQLARQISASVGILSFMISQSINQGACKMQTRQADQEGWVSAQ
mmetsp:Transcript_13910/g.21479  ORF Transcript_13910/g.21479 Transcript_13910/m.21479 type:complete len:86 (+) Transcript_13910:366-623(+)